MTQQEPVLIEDRAVYTRADLARLLNASERHIDRLTAGGHIPGAFKAGRLVRYRRAAVDAWLGREIPSPK